MNYLKGLAGLSRMLEKPNVEAVLAELEKVENTTVGNLVAFMHSYNLRFAPATTPKQRAVYRDLYPIAVAEARDKIARQARRRAGGPGTPLSPPQNPTAVFHGIDPAHLNPRPGANPPPPSPTPAIRHANPRPQRWKP